MFKEGVYTVIVTPFDENDKISYECLDNLVNRQVNTGVDGIILLGTTSEACTISYNEKQILVNYIWNKYNDKIKIIIGIGGNNTNEVINFGKECINICDGFMLTVPYYNKPNQNGIFQHFFKIANSDLIKNKPCMLYNIPSRCGVNMEASTVINLSKTCKNIVAIKEASGNIDQIIKIIQNSEITVFSGDDASILPLMSIGVKGVISVVSNLIPEYIVSIVNSCKNNDFVNGKEKYMVIHNLIKSLFIETNPIPIKYFLNKINLIKTQNVRLPLMKINNSVTEKELNNNIQIIEYLQDRENIKILE